MGVDYGAVGGYGYQFEKGELEYYLKKHLGITEEDEKEEWTNIETEIDSDEDYPKGFDFKQYGDSYSGNNIGYFIGTENIKKNFTPLWKWFRKIGIKVEDPKIVVELYIW